MLKERQYTNHLVHETSPYLLQHAHNPVNWYAWGEEALQKARDEHKIILVSIGYSACHWCHVMERESFENEATAQIMNDNFINIKIDREERPDIDHIYMDAVQAITGSGGWPLNVFLTPDKKPFFGGTYFPPVKAFNRPSWSDVLLGIAQSWKERENEIMAQADHLTDHLSKSGNFVNKSAGRLAGHEVIREEQATAIFTAIMQAADTKWGGFGNAPKFPQTFTIQYLLQYYYFTANETALRQALLSIDKMIQGGIYDHVAGGLARYSTDAEWLAPHFEKMLYDNALLISQLCDAFQITRSKKYSNAINKTLDFILEELLHPLGGFYAALDADSEGEEGRYYVWTKEELSVILGKDSDLFCALYDVTEKGNWEGKNILRLLEPVEEFAKARNLQEAELEQTIHTCLQQLKLERAKRVRPGLDDKIILGWNALMLKSLAKAAVVLQSDQYKNAATTAYQFIVKHFQVSEGAVGFFHTWKDGQAKYPAFLDDYAFFIDACFQMYELTPDPVYLQTAFDYCRYVVEHFSDEDEILFYYTGKAQKDIIVRKKEIYDGATASANAVMANNLLRLSIIFDQTAWLQRSHAMMDGVAEVAVKYPVSFSCWACHLLQAVKGINEIALVGSEALQAVQIIAAENYLPNKMLVLSDTISAGFPFLKDKASEKPFLAYLCKNQVCMQPVTEIAALTRLIYLKDKF